MPTRSAVKLEDPLKKVHVTVHIRHDFSPDPMVNNGWFPNTDVKSVFLVNWSNEDKRFSHDYGEYCVGEASNGVIWFHDGKDRIAAVNKWRIRRYLYRGLDWRFTALLRDYLWKGLIPISEGSCIINFGANIGEVALALNRFGARVLAIEPDPNVLPALRENARGRTIDVCNAVAWKEDGQIDLHIATRKGDTSVINESSETMQAKAVRIDSLVEHNVYLNPHLIVGDAEGAEPEVLMGAADTLKRTKYVSIRVGKERNGECSGPQCREILEQSGFEILVDENEILIGKNKSAWL